MSYFDELRLSMEELARHPRSVFLGQAVKCKGTAMSNTLKGVPDFKKIEFPVAEDMQLGASIGLALNGMLPISIFPRWNFLLLATSQLVLHLDKLPIYSRGGYKPKVIIRTAVATDSPLDPGPQHLGDFTDAFRSILHTVHIYKLRTVADIRKRYQQALEGDNSVILVEMAENYVS